MSELRKANTDLAYFITFTVVGWIDVFTRKELAHIIIEKLRIAQNVYSAEVFHQKMDYIHNNPLMANMVTDPTYYFYSSPNPFSPLKINEY